MKKLILLLATFLLSFSSSVAFAQTDIVIKYDGTELAFTEKPIIVNNKTLVQLRPIAEALELGIEFEMESGTVYLSNEDGFVAFTHNSNVVSFNDEEFIMDVPMIIHNNYTFVPVRHLAEPFGYTINYDDETKTVDIVSGIEEKEEEEYTVSQTEVPDLPKVVTTGSGDYNFVHYYQSQPDLEFPENGRGYCWVCSYAMVFSNLLEEVITPIEIAQYNINAGYDGNYMAGHEELASSFGLELVPALSEDSSFFGGFNIKNRGETTVIAETDEDAKAAICEALDKFPQGVIVRYDGYPHSMVAVSYDEENIYFNDPGVRAGEHIPFEETCLADFKLSDISSIQAFEVR